MRYSRGEKTQNKN